jgi:hypothetical protein
MVKVTPLGTYTYPFRIQVLSLVRVLLETKLPNNTVSAVGGTTGGTTRSSSLLQEKTTARSANTDKNFKCFITNKIV